MSWLHRGMGGKAQIHAVKDLAPSSSIIKSSVILNNQSPVILSDRSEAKGVEGPAFVFVFCAARLQSCCNNRSI
jgi:hypothetical protein